MSGGLGGVLGGADWVEVTVGGVCKLLLEHWYLFIVFLLLSGVFCCVVV